MGDWLFDWIKSQKGSGGSGNWGHRGFPGHGGSSAGTGLVVLGVDSDAGRGDRIMASSRARVERLGMDMTPGQARKELRRVDEARQADRAALEGEIDDQWQHVNDIGAEWMKIDAGKDRAAWDREQDRFWKASVGATDLVKQRQVIDEKYIGMQRNVLRVPSMERSTLSISKSRILTDSQKKSAEKATVDFASLVRKGNGAENTKIEFYGSTAGRASYRPSGDPVKIGEIRMGYASGTKAVVHELGHHLEHADSGVGAKAAAFLASRTAGEKPEWLGGTYSKKEMTRPDEFPDSYCGKVMKSGQGTEIVSMGMEMMWKDPAKFAKQDSAYFDFMFDLARDR